MSRKTGKVLIIHRRHHPKAEVYSLYFPMKQRKRSNTVRRSLHARSCETDGMCRQQAISTNTDCCNTPNKHNPSNVTDSYKPQERITERNWANKGRNRTEDKRKITREKG